MATIEWYEKYAVRDRQFLQDFLDRWEAVFAGGEEINGGDLVEWTAAWLARIRHADDFTCLYCGVAVADETLVPNLDDEEGWAVLTAVHQPGCVWIKTRAHRRPFPLEEEV